MKKIARIFVAVMAVAALAMPHTASAASPVYNGRIAYGTTGSEIKAVKPVIGGLSPKTIVAGNYYNPAYSPDGSKIAYLLATAPTVLYIANADGSNATEVTQQAFYNDVQWAPDGNSLLVTISGYNGNNSFNIFKVDLNGNKLAQLTNFSYYVYGPRYSPDGSKIIYHSKNNNNIYIMNSDGTGVTNLTNGTAGNVTVNKPMFSPDGTKIIYSKIVGGNEVLGMMNVDGSSKVTIPTAGNLTTNAVYSPDGTKIAYAISNTDLHIMNTDGSGDVTYTTDTAGSLSWQALTRGPSSATPNPTVSLSGGKAIVDIAALYADPYGEGVNNATLTVTSTPASGTTSVDTTTGVITYTPRTTASRSLLDDIAAVFTPRVSAAAASDSFTYRICSTANAALCSTGTVNVNLLGAPNTGGGVPPSPLATILAYGLLSTGLTAVGFGIRALLKRHMRTL